MAISNIERQRPEKQSQVRLLVPIVVLWGIVGIALAGYLWVESGLASSLRDFYLVPWVILASICVISPSVYLFYTGKFDFFHPLVFAAWSYILPALVLGGLLITFGLVSPYYLTYIDDPEYNLPLTLVYVSVGFVGLTIGFALPVGKSFALKLENRLPTWQWDPSSLWLPGIVLLFAGISINLLAVIQGVLGYQQITTTGLFDGLISFLVIILSVGYVMIWLGVFSQEKRTGLFYLSILVALLFIPARMALMGNRGAFLMSALPIALAFQYSGRRLRPKYAVVFGFILSFAVIIGVVYGTAFRNIKGSEARMDAGDYFGVVADTVAYIASEDPVRLAQTSLQSLADRVENLSSLGVVVANYERLAPYEASYGIENNIVNDALTAFIPRFVWPDKPNTSDARAYTDLYFDYGASSSAMTPFGDLLRNFGPIGVPIGMLLVGLYLRTIYCALIDTPNPALWKKAVYFPLLTVVSYESFYATILPSIIRTVFVVALSLFLANLFVRKVKAAV